jgi:hypothetical protein
VDSGAIPLSVDVVLGLRVEFDDIDGATECVPIVDVADAGGTVGENGEGVGRSLIDET